MSDRKPSDDLKEGLGLLFRAARGLAKEATPETAERAVSDGARELVRIVNDVGRAIGAELEKSFGGPAKAEPKPTEEAPAAEAKSEAKDASAPEEPKAHLARYRRPIPGR